jgi:hypothetical protein
MRPSAAFWTRFRIMLSWCMAPLDSMLGLSYAAANMLSVLSYPFFLFSLPLLEELKTPMMKPTLARGFVKLYPVQLFVVCQPPEGSCTVEWHL